MLINVYLMPSSHQPSNLRRVRSQLLKVLADRERLASGPGNGMRAPRSDLTSQQGESCLTSR